MMRDHIHGSACDGCAVITAAMGWPYDQLVRNATGETWPERVVPFVPRKARRRILISNAVYLF